MKLLGYAFLWITTMLITKRYVSFVQYLAAMDYKAPWVKK